jgi:site-specific recombinase XerC
VQKYLYCEHEQLENLIHSLGSDRTLAAFAHLVIYGAVNVWLSLWEGMVDRRIYHANTKFTGHSRTSSRLEQRSHRRPKAPAEAQTCLAIRVRLELAKNHRDLALFNMAIDSKLRGCDLVRMKVVDVMATGQIKARASVLQSKTQKPVRFEISEGTRASVATWMKDPLMVGSEFLWPGRFHERLHISTRQYARIVRDWVSSIGLEVTAYGTHSMRRTKVTQIYKKTGNLRAVQLLLGHTKMDSTVRYLGVELEDALAIAEAIEI